MMRPSDIVMAQLADFNAWSKTGPHATPIDLIDFVGFVATSDIFFGFAALFYPDLVVHCGRRFLAAGFSTLIHEQWRRSGRSHEEIQRVMNHVHISTLFQNQRISDEVAVEAARTIAAIWSRTLGPDGLVSEAIGDCFDNAGATFFEA